MAHESEAITRISGTKTAALGQLGRLGRPSQPRSQRQRTVCLLSSAHTVTGSWYQACTRTEFSRLTHAPLPPFIPGQTLFDRTGTVPKSKRTSHGAGAFPLYRIVVPAVLAAQRATAQCHPRPGIVCRATLSCGAAFFMTPSFIFVLGRIKFFGPASHRAAQLAAFYSPS